MRMHPAPAARPPFGGSDAGSFLSTALPLLLATLGMLVIGIALIMNLGVLVLAGAGLAVIGTATYLIVAALDRADRRQMQTSGSARLDATASRRNNPLPPRGPLADAAVDALTRSDGPSGIWPPLSSQEHETAEKPVAMWDAHGRVAPPSFQDPPGGQSEAPPEHATSNAARTRASPQGTDGQEALVEFTAVGPGNPSGSGPPRTENTRHASPQAAPASGQRDEEDPADPERDLRMWPGAKDLGTWGRWSGQQAAERMSETRRAASMKQRRDRLAERLPTVGAILASRDKEETPPDQGATRGKCSSCERYLWAPRHRPITLKCPGCGHKARLY